MRTNNICPLCGRVENGNMNVVMCSICLMRKADRYETTHSPITKTDIKRIRKYLKLSIEELGDKWEINRTLIALAEEGKNISFKITDKYYKELNGLPEYKNILNKEKEEKCK